MAAREPRAVQVIDRYMGFQERIASIQSKTDTTMKKLFLFLLFFIFILVRMVAQGEAQKTQSLYFDILGMHYNWEYPVAAHSTLNMHAGFSYEFVYSSSSLYINDDQDYTSENFDYDVRGTLGIQYRNYYNLARRDSKGKRTHLNSANFVALDLSLYTPRIVGDIDVHTALLLTPLWGIRRVYSHFFYELNLGLGLGFQDHDFFLSARGTDFKIGITF